MTDNYIFKWDDFQESIRVNFRKLRSETDFCDVTLACEDGQQVEAHKVILSTSSPFFEKLLRRNKHTHPLIYMRGLKSEDLSAIVDFLYFGETSVAQQNLDSFLSIADELKLVGLSSGDDKEVVQSRNLEGGEQKVSEVQVKLEVSDETVRNKRDMVGSVAEKESAKSEEIDQSGDVAFDAINCFATTVATELGIMSGLSLEKITPKANAKNKEKVTKRHDDQEQQDKLTLLSEKICSMMVPSKNKTPNGKMAHTCKVCGKEAQKSNIKHHIERHHMEGWKKDLISCKFCEAISSNEWMENHLLFVHNDKI